MLIIDETYPGDELFDNDKQEFIYLPTKHIKLHLQHSLISVSKWEAKWKIPFLSDKQKTMEQTIDYIRCMTINQNVKDEVYMDLPAEIFQRINDYIKDSPTATWFKEDPNAPRNREIVTAELIYYWMISQNIPMEFQKWHFNRLITLLRVFSHKNRKQRKPGRKESLASRRALMKQRRQMYNDY